MIVKKLLLFSIPLMFMLLVMSASADTDGVFVWTVVNGHATITDYLGHDSDISVPSSLGGDPVTVIGSYAFELHTDLASIILPEGLLTIEASAFSKCSSLQQVQLPGSVLSIGPRAFAGCSQSLVVTAGNSIASISSNAFDQSATVLCDIDSETAHMLPYGFSIASSPHLTLQYRNGILTLTGYHGTVGNALVPEGVEAVADGALRNCSSLTSLRFPTSLREIGEDVCYMCTCLVSADIRGVQVHIGNNAFRNCTSLSSLLLDQGVSSVGSGAFQGCSSLTDVHVPWGLETIDDTAFSFCPQLRVYWEYGFSGAFGQDAMKNCSAFVCDLSSSVADWARSHNIPVEELTFSTLTLPAHIQTVDAEAFVSTGAQWIVLPEGCQQIGDYAFAHCSNLCRISIPQSIVSIGDHAFDGCKAVLILTQPGSYADAYATEHGMPVIYP